MDYGLRGEIGESCCSQFTHHALLKFSASFGKKAAEKSSRVFLTLNKISAYYKNTKPVSIGDTGSTHTKPQVVDISFYVAGTILYIK